MLVIPQRRIFAPLVEGKQYAFATTLMAICGYCYGVEFMDWDPATIRLELTEDLGVKPDEGVLDKINAAIAAVNDDNTFDDPIRFHTVMTTLYDLDAPVQDWDEPEVEEIAWGFSESLVLRGEKAMPPISDDVARYAGVVLSGEGFAKPPAALSWAKLNTDRLNTFSDDPIMFESIMKSQDELVKQVDTYVSSTMAKLMEQLRTLQLGPSWVEKSELLT